MSSVIRGDDNFDTNLGSARAVLTSGMLSTTSTTLVDIAGHTVTIATGANPIVYGVAQTARANSDTYFTFNITIDGALELGSQGISYRQTTASYNYIVSYQALSAPLSAGNHTIKQQFRVNTGSGSILNDTYTSTIFYAYEVR